jgi:hypothetical protein
MKTHKLLLWFFVSTAFVIACQKERSYENGKGSPSDGSLQSGVTGDCLGSVLAGTYKKDTVLNSTNYVDVKVDVNTGGSYVIGTDTINGFFFRATGTFSTTGVNTVRLQGNGKPLAAGTNVFTVTYDSTQCTFSVATVDGGSGGSAVFTLAGSPNNCTPGTTQGPYAVGTPTSNLNTATIQVNVTTAGAYSITTAAVDGVTFSVSSTFASTGTQTVTLTASGTPTATGSFSVPVTAGSSTCSFPLTVSPIDYYPRTTNSNWSYNLYDDTGALTDTLLRKVIAPTKSALGNTYNIFMETYDASAGFDSSGYFRRAGGDYYQYVDIGFVFGLDNDVWGEYIFLKDNVAAGTTWRSSTYNGSFSYADSTGPHTVPITVRLKETIQQKDVSVTVSGTSYPFTIVVKEEYEYSFDGGTTWNVSDVYSIYNYARNIGLVKWEEFLLGSSQIKQEITRSQVF